MGVAADGEHGALWDLDFGHGGFFLEDFGGFEHDLVGISAVELLAFFEALNHVEDEFRRHFLLELHSIIAGIDRCFVIPYVSKPFSKTVPIPAQKIPRPAEMQEPKRQSQPKKRSTFQFPSHQSTTKQKRSTYQYPQY